MDITGVVEKRSGVQVPLLLLALASGVSWGLIWSILAPFLRGLGYSGAEYGALGGSAVVISALFTMISGVLSDVIGAKRTIIIGLLVKVPSLLLIATGERSYVVAGFILNGVSQGLLWTAETTLVSRSGVDERLHYTFSYVGAVHMLGGAVGSFMGWVPVLASRAYGVDVIEAYRATLQILAIAPLAVILAASRIRELGVSGGSVIDAIRGFRGLGAFYKLAFFNVLIGFGAAMSIHNIDYYFTVKFKTTSAELGSVLGLQQLFMGLIMIRLPRLADRFGGPLRVYLALTLPSIPLLVAMTFTHSYIIASSLYLVRSILMNVANPLFNAFAMSLVPVEKRGVASAFISLSWTIPAGGGRAVGGYLLDIDIELPLRLTALLYAASLSGMGYVFKDSLNKS